VNNSLSNHYLSTVHAREWITTMTVEYLAYQLIAGYGKSRNVTAYLDDYDFYLLPIVNPDGDFFPSPLQTSQSPR
jgi:murein tripeptide amidase MpaA